MSKSGHIPEYEFINNPREIPRPVPTTPNRATNLASGTFSNSRPSVINFKTVLVMVQRKIHQPDPKLWFLATLLYDLLYIFLASLLPLAASLLAIFTPPPPSISFLLPDPLNALFFTIGLGLATYGIFTNSKILLLPLVLFNHRVVTSSLPAYLDLLLAAKLLLQLQFLLLLLTCLLIMESCQHSFRDQPGVDTGDSQGQ